MKSASKLAEELRRVGAGATWTGGEVRDEPPRDRQAILTQLERMGRASIYELSCAARCSMVVAHQVMFAAARAGEVERETLRAWKMVER